jgi:MFS family permease
MSNALPSLAYRRYVLGLLAVVYVVNFMDRNILTILLQPIKDELALSDTQLGLLSGIAFALFYVTLGVPIARLADRYNRVNIISFSIFLWSLMTAVCGFANNFMQLLLARIGVGIG